MDSKYIIAYDIGSSAVKTCLFKADTSLELLASAAQYYGLYYLPNGGAEQDTDEIWSAMCQTTSAVLARSGIHREAVSAITFCSQMQSVIVVDKDGQPLRRSMNCMDARASAEINKGFRSGFTVSGMNVRKAVRSLWMKQIPPTFVTDQIWRYQWIKNNEPQIFQRIFKWLDMKEFFILKCTGSCILTHDTAYVTQLYDVRKGHDCFSPELCKTYGIQTEHLPKVISSTDVAGYLTKAAADELSLLPGIPVFGGGSDTSLVALGSGYSKIGQTHIYWGTSAWVSTVTDNLISDVLYLIGTLVGVEKGKYNYLAEIDTGGKSFDWARQHLAMDDINVYTEKMDVAEDTHTKYSSVYEYLTDLIEQVEPGCHGLIFTPWLHGLRCPVEDKETAGMFFNLTLSTGKAEMVRAVLEGICFQMRWMLERSNHLIRSSETLRFCGGGARSESICQMMADITGCRIEAVSHPQDVGAVGAALLAIKGLGMIDTLEDSAKYVNVAGTYEPDAKNRAVYDRNYKIFVKLYKVNRPLYHALHQEN